MYPDHTAPSNPGLRNFLFYFSNNLAILLAISGTTADQTAPYNQGLHGTLFYRFKQTQKKYGGDSILNIGLKYSSIHCVSRSSPSAPSNPGLRNFLFYFFY